MLTSLGVIFFLVLPGLLLGRVLWFAYLEYRSDRIPILLYHRLIPREAARSEAVPDKEIIWVCYDTSFDEQMTFLRDAGYETLDLDDYLRIRRRELRRPERPILVTFDDGYLSNYTLAFPALRRLGLRATIFAALEPDAHTRSQVAGIDRFLTPVQMREMSREGVSIQSHTLTHRLLTELDDEEVSFELEESRRRLEEVTGLPVRHLAVPRAGYDGRVRRLVKEAGYETACGNRKGTATGLSDPLSLPRIVIERDMSLTDFRRSLLPGWSVGNRIVGELKRLPGLLLGPRGARRLRGWLYGGRLRPLFRSGSLKKALVVAALLYGFCLLWFLLSLFRG